MAATLRFRFMLFLGIEVSRFKSVMTNLLGLAMISGDRYDQNCGVPSCHRCECLTPSVHRRLLKRAKSTNGIWKINGRDVKQHKMFAPPTDAQVEFLAELKGPHAALHASELAAVKARQLRNSIVNELLVPDEGVGA